MSKVTDGCRTYFYSALTTAREIGQYASEEMIDCVIAKLAASHYSKLGKVCYVFGGGSQPRSVYTELEKQADIHVIYCESLLPRGLRFIPSYRGLVKINKETALSGTMGTLMEQSIVVALIFDSALEGAFVEAVRHTGKHNDYSFGVKEDPGYMIYLVDGDRDDSPTGMVHFLSYGADGPWKTLFEEFVESEAE